MFYPTNLEPTEKETIGVWYKRLRQLTTLVIITSGFVFGYLNKTVGFWMLMLGSFAQVMLLSRENYIHAIWHIRRGGDLMERLLFSGDRKFVLKQLTKDALWRGEASDPEVTRQLDEMQHQEEDFKSKMDEIINKLTESLTTPKDEPKAN